MDSINDEIGKSRYLDRFFSNMSNIQNGVHFITIQYQDSDQNSALSYKCIDTTPQMVIIVYREHLTNYTHGSYIFCFFVWRNIAFHAYFTLVIACRTIWKIMFCMTAL